MNRDIPAIATGVVFLWLIVPAASPHWLPSVLLTIMAIALVDSARIAALPVNSETRASTTTLERITVGICAGWASAAVFVNWASDRNRRDRRRRRGVATEQPVLAALTHDRGDVALRHRRDGQRRIGRARGTGQHRAVVDVKVLAPPNPAVAVARRAESRAAQAVGSCRIGFVHYAVDR